MEHSTNFFQIQRLLGLVESTLKRSSLVLFARNGDEVCVSSGKDTPLDLLLLAGRPFNEEIARYGPFVMNTRQEIFEAFQDYQQGKMGMIS